MGCGALVGLGLMGAGTGLSEWGNVRAQGAMESAAQNELARQRGYQQRATGVFNQSLSQSTPQAAMQNIGQGQQQYLSAMRQAALPQLGLPSNVANLPGSNIVDTGEKARAAQTLGAASDLGGYGNYELQNRLNSLNTWPQLNIIGNEAQQSANVLPLELQQASQSQTGLQSIGQLLNMAGMMTGLYGLTQAPAGAGMNFGATLQGAPQMLPVTPGFVGPYQAMFGLGGI